MTDVPDAALRARQMYADGATIVAIRAATGITHHALYRAIEGGGGLPALPKRRIVKKARISAGDRVSLIARIMRSSERQVAEIEKRIGTPDDQGEKDSRALALLARTVRELTAVDAMNRDLARELEQTKRGSGDDANRNDIPRDVDELRRSLSRKLDALVAEQSAESADGGEGS